MQLTENSGSESLPPPHHQEEEEEEGASRQRNATTTPAKAYGVRRKPRCNKPLLVSAALLCACLVVIVTVYVTVNTPEGTPGGGHDGRRVEDAIAADSATKRRRLLADLERSVESTYTPFAYSLYVNASRDNFAGRLEMRFSGVRADRRVVLHSSRRHVDVTSACLERLDTSERLEIVGSAYEADEVGSDDFDGDILTSQFLADHLGQYVGVGVSCPVKAFTMFRLLENR